MIIYLLAFLSIISSSDTATIAFDKIKNDPKAVVEIIKVQAPNGVWYPSAKKYTLSDKVYVEPIRRLDFDNPVLDERGNVRYYNYKAIDKVFKEITTETIEDIRQEIKDEWDKEEIESDKIKDIPIGGKVIDRDTPVYARNYKELERIWND